jgi:Aldo/keto reductase family
MASVSCEGWMRDPGISAGCQARVLDRQSLRRGLGTRDRHCLSTSGSLYGFVIRLGLMARRRYSYWARRSAWTAEAKECSGAFGGLEVSAVGLGCATMTPFYDEPDGDTTIDTLRHAREIGVDFLDSSDAYGQGRNEALIACAIKGHRDDYVIASKFGNLRAPDGSDPSTASHSLGEMPGLGKVAAKAGSPDPRGRFLMIRFNSLYGPKKFGGSQSVIPSRTVPAASSVARGSTSPRRMTNLSLHNYFSR